MPALTLALAASNLRDTYTGSWSPYALLFTIFMLFVGLGLLVALLFLAMMGRLSPKPKQQKANAAPGGADDATDAVFNLPEGNAAPPAEKVKKSVKIAQRKEAAQEETGPLRRKTGWQHLLGAMACCIASVMVFSWIDNPLGKMQSVTFGAVVNLLLFALQIFLTVRLVQLQRRLRP